MENGKTIIIRNLEELTAALAAPADAAAEKLIIDGQDGVISGDGQGTGALVKRSHVVIRNVTFEHFYNGVEIVADSEDLCDITVEKCEFIDVISEGVSTAIKKSGLTISDIAVEDCSFTAPTAERMGHCCTAINFMTACYESANEPMDHVTLRNVRCNRNHLRANPTDGNVFMLGITAHGACNHSFYNFGDMLATSKNDVQYSLEENLEFVGNVVDGVFDIGIDVLAGLPGHSDCAIRGVLIADNTVTYHNTAINVGSVNVPCSGEIHRCSAKNFMIRGNTVIPAVPGPNEPQTGIMVFAIRAESQVMQVYDCTMEDIAVVNNDVKGREVGIALKTVHATIDLPYPSHLERISLKRVVVANNNIHQAQYPIRMFATHLEGRVDPFWGYLYPGHDESLPYSTLVRDIRMDDITVLDNEIYEYDIAVTLGACWACGWGFVTNSVAGPNLLFSGNKTDKGPRIFSYRKWVFDNDLYDHAIGVDNHVVGEFEL